MERKYICPFRLRVTDPVLITPIKEAIITPNLKDRTSEPVIVLPDGYSFLVFDGNHRVILSRRNGGMNLSGVIVESSEELIEVVGSVPEAHRRVLPQNLKLQDYSKILAHLQQRAKVYDPLFPWNHAQVSGYYQDRFKNTR